MNKRLHVLGFVGCGKTTFMKEFELLVTDTNIIEHSSRSSFLYSYVVNDPIIIIQTNPIFCYQRNLRGNNFDRIIYMEQFLNYVTSLPNCTIINNDLTEIDFKVKIKKYHLGVNK